MDIIDLNVQESFFNVRLFNRVTHLFRKMSGEKDWIFIHYGEIIICLAFSLLLLCNIEGKALLFAC